MPGCRCDESVCHSSVQGASARDGDDSSYRHSPLGHHHLVAVANACQIVAKSTAQLSDSDFHEA
jgi:hypothetical protein